ncbi:TPA: tetratricopeptide repeat protein [Pasteurella multocida]|nr:tetratricopeptide repeat protein [Pasteurella multocida]HDR0683692.1 tetratricopeptide repeat protein [Pasteurella multocida]HDR0685798.1 tetratricopeptide repeat protein [Pasteurella multocida]HDR0687913.1 tetratricopeptide repeat protein [Pasteurella multocida]HDR0707156.1 tetratricopeptide repeat protein [Pasteurella multocida]
MTKSEKYFDEAKKAYDHGNFEKTIELLNKINPQDKAFYFKAQFNLARILKEKGELDKAIETYCAISREDSPEMYARAQFNLALIWEEKGEQEQAIAAYQAISREDSPEVYAKAQFNLALIWEEKGELNKAIETYKAISRENSPEVYVNAQFNLARILKEKGEQDKVIEIYRAISREDDREAYAKAQGNLARILEEQGEKDKAIVTYRTILREDSSKFYAYAQLDVARILREKGDIDKAIEIYRAILREDDRETYAKAQFNLARILEGQGKKDKAIATYHSISREDSSKIYAYAQFNLARIFSEQGKKDKAIEAYRAISREGDRETYAKAQFNLALIFEEKGELDKAIETYKAILREDSLEVYEKAQFNLASIFEEKGELDKAKDAYSRVESDNNPGICYLAEIKVRILSFEGNERKGLDDIYSNVMEILNILHVTFDGDIEEDCKQVAHYTRPSTALKLLGLDNTNGNSSFRLNTIHGVNDPTEGRVFYRFLHFNDAQEQKDNTAFISCFTFNHDSLNQFRLYGKEEGKEASGVSMVFNVRKFFNNNSNEMFISFSNDLIKASDIENKQESQMYKSHQETYLPLYRCVYLDPVTGYISLAKRTKITFFRENEGNSDNRWCKYQKKMLEKEKQAQECLNKIKETLDGIEEKDKANEVIQYILLPLKYLVKHYAFEEEQECRMIAIHSLIKDSDKVKTDIATKSMYVEYPVDVKNAIEKVYLSVGAREYESFFIKALGDSRKVRISDNPFRAKS